MTIHLLVIEHDCRLYEYSAHATDELASRKLAAFVTAHWESEMEGAMPEDPAVAVETFFFAMEGRDRPFEHTVEELTVEGTE